MRIGGEIESDQPFNSNSRSALRSLVAAAPLPLIAVDRAGIVIAWNPAAERMFGWTEAEVLNQQPPIFPDEMEEQRQTFLRETLNGRLHHDIEVVRQRRDGAILPLSLSTAPLFDAEGQIAGTVFTYLDLTERKRMEEALRESQERFQGAFDFTAIGMALVDLDGHWLRVNRALCEVVGYTEDELLRLTFQDITHPDDLDIDLAYAREMVAGKRRTYQMEKRYIRKDGQTVHAILSVSLVHTAAGAPLYFVSQIQDISARKMAEEALLKGTAMLQDQAELLDLAYDAIFVRAFETAAITFWNRGAERMYGFTRGTAMGCISHALLHTVFPEPLDQIEATVREAGYWEGELLHTARDGRQLVIASRWALRRNSSGTPIGILEINNDITERKRSEQALEASERRFRTLIATAPIGICVVGPTGIFEHVNDAYARIFGFSVADVVGQHYSLVVPPGVSERLAQDSGDELAAGTARLGEFDLLHRSGERVTVLTTTVSLDPAEPMRRAIFALDISERKQAEVALFHQATHDQLTGLGNRFLLEDQVQRTLAHAMRHGERVAVLFIDLDRFKTVNDRFGHARGDDLLKEVAYRLKDHVRPYDTIARLAGDEFVVVLPDIESVENAVKVANKLIAALNIPFQIAGQTVRLGGSIGISFYPTDGETRQSLLSAADKAMYRAKRQGRSTYALHDPAVDA